MAAAWKVRDIMTVQLYVRVYLRSYVDRISCVVQTTKLMVTYNLAKKKRPRLLNNELTERFKFMSG